MAGMLTSPKIDLKIKNRNAIERRSHGSPNFKDILRQRCKERMKSKRYELINHLRALSTEEDKRTLLNDIIEKDLLEFKPGMQCDESICDEEMDLPNTLSQEEQWILDEYDRLLESNEALQDILQQVVCPFCEKDCLDNSVPGLVKCNSCKTALHQINITLLELEQRLIEAINVHENMCLEKPVFSIIPDNFASNLFLICPCCGYIHTIL